MVTLIVAQDEQGAIGNDNDLPWPRIKEDMKFFKDTTTGHAIIMGRKTSESLPDGKPLPDRYNIVLSSNYSDDDVPTTGDDLSDIPLYKVDSIAKAFAIVDEYLPEGTETFIIGGAQIYNLALRYADRILLTRVVGTYPADVFLNLGLDGWTLESSQEVKRKGKLICTFESYRRTGSADTTKTE